MTRDDEIDKLPGLKESELVKLGPCAVCRKPLLAVSGISFYVLRISRALLVPDAIKRRVGFGMMLGSDALAHVMGPDDDLAKVISEPKDVLVHEDCATEIDHLLLLIGEGDG